MFYYPTVLQRRSGRFATIWLAATSGVKIMKREYLKVDVPKTCEEIIAYVLAQVEPTVPGGPRPRFSLYLSSQLGYGVVCVYHKQCDFLIDEIKAALEHLRRAEKQLRIDMVQLEQPGLLLPDHLSIMKYHEDAPDPFFGVMDVEPDLPSPMNIPQLRSLLETPSPVQRLLEETPPRPRTRKPDQEYVSTPERITMREVEPIRLPEVEYERDLQEITAQELEFLMGEEVVFPQEEFPVGPPEREEVPKRPSEIEVTPAEPRIPMSPPAVLSPRAPAPPRSPELQLEDIDQQPRAMPGRPRRRQLRFTDEEMQIPQVEMERLMQDVHAHCQPRLVVELPRDRRRSPTDLLNNPTYDRWMPPELRRLWSRCANVQSVDYASLHAAAAAQEEEEEEEAEMRRQQEEAERRRQQESISELEAVREGLERTGTILSSEISLEISEEEKSRQMLVTPEERRIRSEVEEPALPILFEQPEPGQVVSELQPELEPMVLEPQPEPMVLEPQLEPMVLEPQPEPMVLEPQPEPEPMVEEPQQEQISLESVFLMVQVEIDRFGETDFETLVPYTTSRLIASQIFFNLLVLSSMQILKLDQEQPYERIRIRPGPRYQQ